MPDKFANLEQACGGRINPESLMALSYDLEFQTSAVKREYYEFMDAGRKMFSPVTERSAA